MIVYAQHALDDQCKWPRRGNLGFIGEGGRTIAEWTLEPGKDNQSCLFETPPFRASGGEFYACAWWRFPVGYNHNGAPGYAGREHKLFCISVEDPKGKGRVLVNAQGQEGHLRAYVEGFDSDPRGRLLLDCAAVLPLDGQWHPVEVLIARDSAGMGNVGLWLDGKPVGTAAGATGNSPFTSLQVGAYVNQGSDVRKSFQVRDLFCSDGKQAMQVLQPPTPPDPFTPAAEIERAVRDLEDMMEQAAAWTADLAGTARRLRGLLR